MFIRCFYLFTHVLRFRVGCLFSCDLSQRKFLKESPLFSLKGKSITNDLYNTHYRIHGFINRLCSNIIISMQTRKGLCNLSILTVAMVILPFTTFRPLQHAKLSVLNSFTRLLEPNVEFCKKLCIILISAYVQTLQLSTFESNHKLFKSYARLCRGISLFFANDKMKDCRNRAKNNLHFDGSSGLGF